MSIDIADAEHFRPMLEAELKAHARQPVDLVVVDDVAEWASSRKGNATGNPPAMAIADPSSGRWGIVLRRTIDAPWVASILDRIEVGANCKAREVLSTPQLFARHLVLHELAHLENEWGQERENDCDAWAFERMAGHAI
jgi:hypothetical protein